MGVERDINYYNKRYLAQKSPIHYSKSVLYNVYKTALNFIEKIETRRAILEIGCGTGQFAHLLFDNKFYKYLGFDFSNVAITIATEGINQSFRVFDAYNYSIYRQTDYTIVVALEVFEHLENDLQILDYLVDNSLIILSLPCFNSKAHVRWFENKEQIINRYDNYIDFISIIKIRRWFVCFGKIK